ncbi:hypothetical protein [Clavibacter sp.]|uniref:hypothetical protein n=1 Tax=Clavibacter sp. TaxID=1871044 RepID=UPI00198E9D6E|nr:hypothetical protein [Clavibacter sp.]MBD5381989.1 hypothetical protein [Clavibacter sp.]
MSEFDYGVSYIASAPEELKVGDRVEVVYDKDIDPSIIGKQGRVILKGVGCESVKVRLDDTNYILLSKYLRKLPDPMTFEEDSDNVKAFMSILNEMEGTYKAKNKTYGDAYQDGFNRFGAVQLVSRMYEKYCRIENLLVRNADNKVPDESIIDTLTDLAVQAICLRMLLQKNDFKNGK